MKVPHGLRLLAVMAVVLGWVFWVTFVEMGQRWGSQSQYSHGWLVPVHAALYKLYVVRQLAKANEPLMADEPAVQFMEVFLPVVQEALFGENKGGEAKGEGREGQQQSLVSRDTPFAALPFLLAPRLSPLAHQESYL